MSKTLGHALIAALLLTGCIGMPEYSADPETLTQLARCPSSPNCVSSAEDRDDSHYIAPIRIQGDPAAAWQALQEMLAEDDSFDIVASSDRYIRAVATTKILRFKDDVELLLDRNAETIATRSASQIAYSDQWKNRSRVEDIRQRMIDAGAAAGN